MPISMTKDKQVGSYLAITGILVLEIIMRCYCQGAPA